mgnify:CR=1 FL=1
MVPLTTVPRRATGALETRPRGALNSRGDTAWYATDALYTGGRHATRHTPVSLRSTGGYSYVPGLTALGGMICLTPLENEREKRVGKASEFTRAIAR